MGNASDGLRDGIPDLALHGALSHPNLRRLTGEMVTLLYRRVCVYSIALTVVFT